jgi:hypothetical protein
VLGPKRTNGAVSPWASARSRTGPIDVDFVELGRSRVASEAQPKEAASGSEVAQPKGPVCAGPAILPQKRVNVGIRTRGRDPTCNQRQQNCQAKGWPVPPLPVVVATGALEASKGSVDPQHCQRWPPELAHANLPTAA